MERCTFLADIENGITAYLPVVLASPGLKVRMEMSICTGMVGLGVLNTRCSKPHLRPH